MSLSILAFSGSSRSESLNGRLLAAAVDVARSAGAQVSVVNLRDLQLPLYDGDLETGQGLPAGALALRKMFIEHDALLVASPEYNGFFSPALKNAIDWVSRPAPAAVMPVGAPFSGKVAALVAASPGALGGIRGLPHVRLLLSNLGVNVVPGQLAVGRADQAFAPDGRLADATLQKNLEQVVADLVRVGTALARR